ncbi:PQQ-dependent sugar dehydrogenase [Fulvivirga maritima]|uniref:PQQ-dependent sugar dehydrogenase n=1 Tax=Fulvivirga maritima TaxID=2904247 RepID=UPI001F2FBDF0|nr:PQQ-dependent sugar dehydrogenase [Fulvivirga maritima]UII26331.1 PQQ-dependent sugar dehydrogenase [Fulvivirga maritima]
MKNQSIVSLVGMLMLGCLSFACSSDDEATPPTENPGTPTDSLLAPVETLPPNTDYEPAFEGQTRINGVATETEYQVTEFATGLSNPWGMTNLPDGRILLTEKGGTMRIISTSGQVSNAITGLPSVNSSGQGGLLDVAIDPDFTTNRLVYWTFSLNGQGGTATAVGKGRLADDEETIENAEVIYTAIPFFNSTLHYGGRLAWDGDGNLFVSTGERSDLASRPEAQELDAALGKVLRITTDGDPVADNPFVGQQGILPEIYSYGHRNPQGLAIHPTTGDLWEVEMGPRGGDEVNLISAGDDYGWPTISYGIEYSGGPIGEGITQQEGMEQPEYYWDPVVSPSGVTFYTGSLISEWTNNLFLAGLSGQHVVRLVIEDNAVVGEERLLEDEGHRFRDVLEGVDGALYAVTDEENATLYRIGL